MYSEIFQTWVEPLTKARCIELLDEMLLHLDVLYENRIVYPTKDNIFRAFRETPYNETKVILLGQDPYHDTYKGIPNACGLSFITESGYTPPSLKRMFIELESDDTLKRAGNNKNPYTAQNYPFKDWTKQGVLMLNSYLTVERGSPCSHHKVWETWTSRLIKYLVETRPDIVWLLLGRHAQELLKDYDCKKVESIHPSPFTGNAFFNSKIYSRVNSLLENKITW